MMQNIATGWWPNAFPYFFLSGKREGSNQVETVNNAFGINVDYNVG